MSSYGTVTCAATATLLIADNSARREIDLVNTDSSTIIYIGIDDSVTTSNGFPIYARQNRSKVDILTTYKGPIYGISASGNVDVRYWETTQDA